MARRPNANWPAAFPPLELAVRSVDGANLAVFVTHETHDKAPVLVIRSGMWKVQLTAADMRRMAQMVTDHERLHQAGKGSDQPP
jgi:(2Fe-2S) ferredoxin